MYLCMPRLAIGAHILSGSKVFTIFYFCNVKYEGICVLNITLVSSVAERRIVCQPQTTTSRLIFQFVYNSHGDNFMIKLNHNKLLPMLGSRRGKLNERCVCCSALFT